MTGSEVRDLFATSQVSAQVPHRPQIMSREFWTLARRSNFLGDPNVWWANWVPVAATGWGAVFLIAPLVLVNFLVWAAGPRVSDHPAADGHGPDYDA